MMSKLKFLPRVLAEAAMPADFHRRNEPCLVMNGTDQVEAYAAAGRSGGGMFAVHLFHAAHMSQSIAGARMVLDLACGPGTQLLLMARLHPEIRFVGVDLSARMLAAAERTRVESRIVNAEFVQADITDLRAFRNSGFDAVISTMALHHLPTSGHLRAALDEVAALNRVAVQVYLADLLRPQRSNTVDFMARMAAGNQPKAFNDDFRNSMIAGFKHADFTSAVKNHLPACEVITTFPLKLFVVIRTKPKPLEAALRERLGDIRAEQGLRVRKDLDDLRGFFRAGGLKPDPFCG